MRTCICSISNCYSFTPTVYTCLEQITDAENVGVIPESYEQSEKLLWRLTDFSSAAQSYNFVALFMLAILLLLEDLSSFNPFW